MIVTCPACGRKTAVAENAREVVCDCGRLFDPAARPTVADPFLGKDLAGYRIEGVIGTGGMGTVYRATQLSLNRPVALKVLPPNVADDPQFVHRFHREAQVLASLSHPHIVQVIDRGEVDGRYFIVMEYVDGTSLREFIRRGQVPGKEACRIVASLLDALDYAHSRGVVHRDIKPENVLISKDGVVKVADFGLSRVLGGEEGDTRLTRTHLVLGTYEYMSPEQREGARSADSRSDIYAVAVVLYEMLTGELPIGRFRLPSERVPGVDRRLDRILERGLAKDPGDRFERASAMGRELAALVSSPEAPVDLDALRHAAGRFAERVFDRAREGVRRVVGRPGAPVRPPTAFEMRLDLLATVLSVCGILLSITGLILVFANEFVEVGLLEIDRDVAGVVILVYGLLLWNASERLRKYWLGARVTLLVLTAIGGLTLVGLPLTLWTWWALLEPGMRTYLDARNRGLDAHAAAALAQGVPLPDTGYAQALERRRAAANANRVVAGFFLFLALGFGIAWITILAGGELPFRDEGLAFLTIASISALLAYGFNRLRRAVSNSRGLRLNALVWSVLALLRPSAGRRARVLLRDRRDGLI